MPIGLLPQPPPGVPAPPAGEAAVRSRSRLHWIILLGFISLLVVVSRYRMNGRLVGSGGCIKSGDLVEAVGNAKQLGLALFDFDSRYGTYPDFSTAIVIKSQTGSTWALGSSSSNDLFQQLFTTGICESEEMFYAKTPWSKKPDKIQSSEADTLAANECGFAYIVGLSSKSDQDTPVCVTPLEPGKLTFDRDAFKGKAIVLRVDGSAICLSIDKSGRAILNGMDLFDPRQPFWHGKAPTVKWPK